MGHPLRVPSALYLLSILSPILAIPSGHLLPRLTTFETVKEQTYDYVIVGGGLTGLVVANRLSEDPKSKPTLVVKLQNKAAQLTTSESILVIENGPIDTGPATTVPALATVLNVADMYDITGAPIPGLGNLMFPVRGK